MESGRFSRPKFNRPRLEFRGLRGISRFRRGDLGSFGQSSRFGRADQRRLNVDPQMAESTFQGMYSMMKYGLIICCCIIFCCFVSWVITMIQGVPDIEAEENSTTAAEDLLAGTSSPPAGTSPSASDLTIDGLPKIEESPDWSAENSGATIVSPRCPTGYTLTGCMAHSPWVGGKGVQIVGTSSCKAISNGAKIKAKAICNKFGSHM